MTYYEYLQQRKRCNALNNCRRFQYPVPGATTGGTVPENMMQICSSTYILIPVAAMLSTKVLCAKRYRIIRGMMIISVPVARMQLE